MTYATPSRFLAVSADDAGKFSRQVKHKERLLRVKHKLLLADGPAPRFGYDGVTASSVHAYFPKPSFVAGYLDGRYAWSAAEWDLFPESEHVTITVSALANYGDVLDWETGNESAGNPGEWLRMRKAAGYFKPTIYCNGSTIPQVRQLTGVYRLGIDYDLWVADPTGYPFQYVTGGIKCAVTQWKFAGAYDADVAYDPEWPHRTAPVHENKGFYLRHVNDKNQYTSLAAFARSKKLTTNSVITDTRTSPIDKANRAAFDAYVKMGVDKQMPKGLVWYTWVAKKAA